MAYDCYININPSRFWLDPTNQNTPGKHPRRSDAKLTEQDSDAIQNLYGPLYLVMRSFVYIEWSSCASHHVRVVFSFYLSSIPG